MKLYNIPWLVSLWFCVSVASLEYQTAQGWRVALKDSEVALRDIEKVLVHTTDVSRDHYGKTQPTMQCKDSTKGITGWLLKLPSCVELFHEQNCVYCTSKKRSCCSLELECTSCIKQSHVEILHPRLRCDPFAGNSLRVIDASTCVLEFELSQRIYIISIEVCLFAWIFAYNLACFLSINWIHPSWIIKMREYLIVVVVSFSAVPMLEIYLYIQTWYVIIPFSATYVFLCLLPPFRLVSHVLVAKSKKDIV